MGGILAKRCRGVSGATIINLCPNPKNFNIVELWEFENTYCEAIYPDCKNYEGRKIMVFAGCVSDKLRDAAEIDPHFSMKKLSPIARFEPTGLGRLLAASLAKTKLSHHMEVSA